MSRFSAHLPHMLKALAMISHGYENSWKPSWIKKRHDRNYKTPKSQTKFLWKGYAEQCFYFPKILVSKNVFVDLNMNYCSLTCTPH